MAKIKINLVSFIAGAVVTAVLIGAGSCLLSYGGSFASMQLYTDSDVRWRIASCGIVLPDEAHDLYYAVQGLQDASEWIKFTVPRDQIWAVVEASIKKTRSDFTDGIPEHFLVEIRQYDDQKLDVSWWTPSSVKKPISWSLVTENEGEAYFDGWVIDEETGTFYITRWDT